MNGLTFTEELIKAAVGGAVPTAVLIFGGRWLLDKYDIRKKKREQDLEFAAKERLVDSEVARKRREQEIELVTFVRQRQYEALQELYALFAQYMSFYRLINSGHVDLKDPASRLKLLEQIAVSEGRVDAAILRIASEFTHDNSDKLGEYLANLRQSVQIWRERVRSGQDLPFTSSGQQDYLRFKTAFTRSCTYLASLIYQRLEPTSVVVEQATQVLTDVFDNRHEWHGPSA
jgi:hypothetical protein